MGPAPSASPTPLSSPSTATGHPTIQPTRQPSVIGLPTTSLPSAQSPIFPTKFPSGVAGPPTQLPTLAQTTSPAGAPTQPITTLPTGRQTQSPTQPPAVSSTKSPTSGIVPTQSPARGPPTQLPVASSSPTLTRPPTEPQINPSQAPTTETEGPTSSIKPVMPSISPTATPPSDNVTATPFNVTYTIPGSTPTAAEFTAAGDLTSAYLDQYFTQFFENNPTTNLSNFISVQVGNSGSNNPASIGFQVTTDFTPGSENFPSAQDIDYLIQAALSPPFVQTLLNSLSTLPSSNPLSATTNVTYSTSSVGTKSFIQTLSESQTTLYHNYAAIAPNAPPGVYKSVKQQKQSKSTATASYIFSTQDMFQNPSTLKPTSFKAKPKVVPKGSAIGGSDPEVLSKKGLLSVQTNPKEPIGSLPGGPGLKIFPKKGKSIGAPNGGMIPGDGLKPQVLKSIVKIWPTELQGMKKSSQPLINTFDVLSNATLQPSLQPGIRQPFSSEPGRQQPTIQPSPQQRSHSGSSHPSSYRPGDHTLTSSPRLIKFTMPPSQPNLTPTMKPTTPVSFIPTSKVPVQVLSSPAPSMAQFIPTNIPHAPTKTNTLLPTLVQPTATSGPLVQSISLSPFNITYTISGGVPTANDLSSVAVLTEQYLENYLKDFFKLNQATNISSFSVQTADSGSGSHPTIEYDIMVEFTNSSEIIPTGSELDLLIQAALSLPSVQSFLDSVGELPRGDPFSSTSKVVYSSANQLDLVTTPRTVSA